MTTEIRRHLQAQRRARETDALNATPPADRTPCPPDHSHGVALTCYASHKCRCESCRAAWNAYMREQRARAAEGRARPPKPLPDEVRDNLKAVRESGASLRDIAREVGISVTGLKNIVDGKARATSEETIQRLAKLTPYVPTHHVPVYRAQRRLHALLRRGYDLKKIGRMAGVHPTLLVRLSNGQDSTGRAPKPGEPPAKIERATLEKIDRVFQAYQEIDAETPPHTRHHEARLTVKRTLTRAKNLGYAYGDEWENIDSPTPLVV